MSYKHLMISRSRDVSPDSPKLWEDGIKQTELRRLLSVPLRTEAARERLVMWRLLGEPVDSAFVFFFDRGFRCVKTGCICRGGIRMQDSYADGITRGMEAYGGAYFAVAHNHVNEPLVPSPDDIRLTYTLIRCAEERLTGKSAFLGHYITDGFDAVKIEL